MTRTWKKLKTHKKILNIFENPQKKLASKYFEDPQNILRILTLKIFWGKNLQILNIEVWVFRVYENIHWVALLDTTKHPFPDFRHSANPKKTRFLENASEPRNLKKTLRFPRFRAWGFSWFFRGGEKGAPPSPLPQKRFILSRVPREQ